MGARRCPAQLLPFHEPLAHDLVDSGFDEAGYDRLAVPASIRIVRDRSEVGRHIIHELLKLGLHLLRAIGFGADIPCQVLHGVKRPMRTAVPQIGFRAT